MEIDKDEVVEAARVYVLRIDNEISKNPSMKVVEEFAALKQALNSPPPRPSKEECIEYLKLLMIKSYDSRDVALKKEIISYLKEPSLQLVKNTGVEPEYKKIVVFFRNGEVDIRNLDDLSLRWDLRNIDGDILEYIILE